MNFAERARKINHAIQEGLRRCRHSDAPLVALSQVMDELHADKTWREADVNKIESAIRHVLARVISPSESGIYSQLLKP